MLEENEIELTNSKHEQSLAIARTRLTSASFVEELDKHQLFESIFANNLGNNVSDTEGSMSSLAPIDTNKSSSVQM